MGDQPPDPGGTVPLPPGSDNKPSKMDMLIAAVESSMDTDTSVISNTDNKLKRKILPRICATCHKRKRKVCQDGKEGQSNCQCNKIQMNLPNQNESQEPIVPISDLSNTENHTVLNPSLSEPQASTTSIPNLSPPRAAVGRGQYQPSDSAPYIVHVQREGSEGTTLHPITFGRFLKLNNIKGIENGSLKRVGRNRISLAFTTYTDANNFLTHERLEQEKYKAFIPTFNVTRMGVVKGVPNDWSDDEVLTCISVPVGCGPVLKIRRIKRKVIANNSSQFINTGTIIITFDGQILPTKIYMCYTVLSVELYIYPTVQCYNCCRFGHVKNQCRSTPRCFRCGQGHSGDTCHIEEDEYRCCLCKGAHEAISKKCLELNRQKAIKETMSKSCISYMEATKMHPPVSKISYAEALLAAPTSSPSSYIQHGPPAIHSPSTSNNLTHSYKKTVFLKPKTHTNNNNVSKGYDRLAHAEIIREPVLPKGKPTFNKNNDNNNMSTSDIIEVIIQLLSQSNKIPPSHVAAVIDALYKIPTNNGPESQSDSVELSQSHH